MSGRGSLCDSQRIVRHPLLLLAMLVLGRIADPGAVPILEFCLRYKNRYARKAMDSLAQRSSLFPHERDEIAAVVSNI